MDRTRYRKIARFSDDYFNWLCDTGLLINDSESIYFSLNHLLLQIPDMCWGDEKLAQCLIDQERNWRNRNHERDFLKYLGKSKFKPRLYSARKSRDWESEYISLQRDMVRHLLGAHEYRNAGREDLFVIHVIQAAQSFGAAISMGQFFDLSEELVRLEITERARRGGEARHASDPKQSAKKEAFKLWKERHAGKHPKLRTNEQFASECMRRWPVLTSAKNILGWCTEWNKQAKAGKP
jgi:hypothetical protein